MVQATQKDRTGVFAVGDATPAESSQGGAGGADDVLEIDADGDTDASGMQHEGALEAAALLDALEQVSNVPEVSPHGQSNKYVDASSTDCDAALEAAALLKQTSAF